MYEPGQPNEKGGSLRETGCPTTLITEEAHHVSALSGPGKKHSWNDLLLDVSDWSASYSQDEEEDLPATEPTPDPYLHPKSAHFDMMDLALTSANSARPVDYRWQIADQLAAGKVSPCSYADDRDEWIEKAVDYLQALHRCKSGAERDQLAQQMPHLHAAYQLHQSCPDKLTRKLERSILEARLLAGQTVEETARACQLPVEMVHLYERLFFAVVGKRENWIYLMIEAIGKKCWFGLSEEDSDVIMKKLALVKGPYMVDLLARYYTTEWVVPEKLESLTREQLEELAFLVGTKAMIQSMVVPFRKSHQSTRLTRLEMEILALLESWPEQQAAAQAQADDQLIQAAGKSALEEAASTSRETEAVADRLQVA